MKIVDDLKMTAKVAAANDKDGIALLCLRAIGVIEGFSRASRDALSKVTFGPRSGLMVFGIKDDK